MLVRRRILLGLMHLAGEPLARTKLVKLAFLLSQEEAGTLPAFYDFVPFKFGAFSFVLYRDVAYMVEVALAFGFYATPIIYDLPRDLSPWLYRLYMLNPMAHLIEAYRQALLMNRFPDAGHLLWPLAAAAVALVFGAWVFRRTAPTFADHV